jgi:hypothetical protein
MQTWAAQQQYRVVKEYDPKTTWHSFKIRADVPIVPPEIWGVVLGEIVYQLRSALDHTIWQLVLANHGTPDKGNQFPIFSKPPRPGAFENYVRGIDGRAVKHIRRLQPYTRPNRTEPELLEIIGALSNTDKHQTLHGVAVHADSLVSIDQIRFRGLGPEGTTIDPGPTFRWNYSKGEPIDGAEVFGVQIAAERADVDFEGKAHTQIEIAFGERADFPARKVEDLIAEVQRIVRLLDPFCP